MCVYVCVCVCGWVGVRVRVRVCIYNLIPYLFFNGFFAVPFRFMALSVVHFIVLVYKSAMRTNAKLTTS